MIPKSKPPWGPLFLKELRDLSAGRAFWAALVIVILLTGYSYIQAVTLYAEASRSALKYPDLARGISPLDGILVPTLGSLYLAVTFLFPFIVIRTVGAEKQSGALKMLVQMPYSIPSLVAAKLAAATCAWSVMLWPSLLALAFWQGAGGHLAGAEVANLVLGHFLYASVIASISLLAAALAESSASAAIAAVGVTLGFWVLDFAAAGNNGVLKSLAGFSLTTVLRSFERGIFSFSAVVGSLAAALGLMLVAGTWLHPGRSTGARLVRSAVTLVMTVIVILAVSQAGLFGDATEDRRNSFSRTDESVLKKAQGRLTIEVNLAAEDPRLYDLERSILGKLKRALPDVRVIYADVGMDKVLAGTDDQYGQVVYRHKDRQAMSRSTSEEEVLPIVFEIMGLNRLPSDESATYPGYPLVAGTYWPKMAFSILLPLIALLLWVITQNQLRFLGKLKKNHEIE
jgi:ABC-type transport system involved in multi-copper enzyme maturation permease subunit